ncbi:MAG: UDP-N-acetylmuramate dehydrogenase [Phycisphaeraceae bacterium]|nr:UDP-N-acetylmuramate dehydrogenase [Phycisphaeraceae bacterium]
MPLLDTLSIQADAPIETWFGIGGGARRLARPRSIDELRACLDIDPALVVLGDGANLLVDDTGVEDLVVSLQTEPWRDVEIDGKRVVAGAGVDLPRLLVTVARVGLAGLEGLAGVPGTVGGAIRMNAGGRFGEISDAVSNVEIVARDGSVALLSREDLGATYRRTALGDAVVTRVEFALTPEDPAPLRARMLDVMAVKKRSQPMAERSAGCCFKNPVLARDIDGVGAAGQRVPAGLLLDRAGCKGLRIGGSSVSLRHANFIVARPGSLARDTIDLMDEVACRVAERFDVRLDREVVVWGPRA